MRLQSKFPSYESPTRLLCYYVQVIFKARNVLFELGIKLTDPLRATAQTNPACTGPGVTQGHFLPMQ